MDGVFNVTIAGQLSEAEQRTIERLKEKAQDLYKLLEENGVSRESTLAKAKLEESLMWAMKGVVANRPVDVILT